MTPTPQPIATTSRRAFVCAGKRDFGIRYGQIEAIEASIAPQRAQRVLDAGGKLSTPEPIDLHAHSYPYGSAIGISADELIAHKGTTTVVAGVASGRPYPSPSSVR